VTDVSDALARWNAVLEFTSEVGGREIHGIDMITWDDAA
jgi:hypothetical protein